MRGTWTETEQHKWTFCDDTRTYASEWAAIYNPYADKTKDQQEYDWFRFDESGYMVTGWKQILFEPGIGWHTGTYGNRMVLDRRNVLLL
mgnify:CR=1 FL=1